MNIYSKNSWRDIYDRILPRVFHYFTYRVGVIQTAEDLTSITFEKAWRSRANFKKIKGKPENWLFGIARNVLIDHYRQQDDLNNLEDLSNIPSNHSVVKTTEHNHKFEKLMRLLENQPERNRELISLKYGAELTNRRIAEITGLSETNVGTILHRTVKSLRVQWEDENE